MQCTPTKRKLHRCFGRLLAGLLALTIFFQVLGLPVSNADKQTQLSPSQMLLGVELDDDPGEDLEPVTFWAALSPLAKTKILWTAQLSDSLQPISSENDLRRPQLPAFILHHAFLI